MRIQAPGDGARSPLSGCWQAFAFFGYVLVFFMEQRKMLISVKTFAAAGLILSLVACGGGGGSPGIGSAEIADSGGAASQAKLRPTVITSEGRALFSTCALSPACSGNPLAPFFALAPVAPPDGATVSGIVRIEVRGNEMENIELLPGSGYLPRLGVFRMTGDKALAWMDLDTTKLPNGPLSVRASAFDVPAGQSGATEFVAMSARTWNVSNASPPSSTLTASVTSAPVNGAVVSGITRLEIRGSGIANAELLPATGYTPRLGVFNVSADRTIAWLDFDSRSLPDGIRDVRISAYNVTEGQAGAAEIVAMPARRWDIRNGSASAAPFTGTVTMAPVHGELVNGRFRLEVHGTGMKNVELLPPSGYLPRLGVFSVDFNGTYAYLELDTATLPEGVFDARISAFDVPAGQSGAREIVVMPARQWMLRH